MATLTTSYQMLGQAYLGTSGGNLYVRIYAKYSVQEIANNRSKVQYQARAYYENSTYIYDAQGNGGVSGTGASTVSGSCTRPTTGETVIATAEVWVGHDDAGKKSILASAILNFPNWGWSATASGNADLPTIPRASSISVANYNLGQNISIVIGKKVNSFTSTLTYKIGSLTGTIVSKTSSSTYVWILNNALIEQIKNDNPITKNVSATIYCDTYSDNTKIGSTQSATFTLTIIDKPIINDVSVIETMKLITKYTTKIIKYLSAPQFNIDATAGVGTSMATYKVKCGNIENSSPSNDIVVNNIQYSYLVDNVRMTKFVINAIDKRGNISDDYVLEMGFIEYVNLAFNNTEVKLTRLNSISNFIKVYMTGFSYNGMIDDTENSLKMQYRYKLRNDTTATWSELKEITTTISNNNSFLVNNLQLEDEFDYRKNYDIEFYINDLFLKEKYSGIIKTSETIAKCHQNGMYIREIATENIKSSSGVDRYTKNEVIVGTWIDGKPIYRKVYYIFDATSGYISLNNYSIDKIVSLYGYETSSQYENIPLNFYNNGKYNYLYVEGKIIKYITGWCSEVYIIVEYTKTTDIVEGG